LGTGDVGLVDLVELAGDGSRYLAPSETSLLLVTDSFAIYNLMSVKDYAGVLMEELTHTRSSQADRLEN
jgi:hypothetical protein